MTASTGVRETYAGRRVGRGKIVQTPAREASVVAAPRGRTEPWEPPAACLEDLFAGGTALGLALGGSACFCFTYP